MISQKEFYLKFNTNSPRNPNREKGSLFTRLYFREIAAPIAYYFARFNISANTATLLMGISYILGNIIFASPTVYSIFIFVILDIFGAILDCVDGPLARYFGTTSDYGKILDSFIHTFAASTFAIFFGLRTYFITNNPFVLFLAAVGASAYIFDGLWINKSEEIFKSTNQKNKKRIDYMTILKNIFSFFDYFSYIALTVLLLMIIDKLFNLNLSTIFFEIYVTSIFLTKIIYRFYLLFQQTSIVRGKSKGWVK